MKKKVKRVNKLEESFIKFINEPWQPPKPITCFLTLKQFELLRRFQADERY